ncbi:MAG TPA: UDP-N-acetylmuramoyl-tripeptide--D-alanyl-D-alanine ligase [Hydrogenothermaceae bacterium]|nr:UDP-N-acetylmuramoyl-tripeptide--D-alanyl-D-alanine ligase [Hydrogenothermaceae bacterium]
MKLSQIAKITNAKAKIKEDCFINKFIIDSRDVNIGDFFVPLKGSKLDGHQFIEDAFKKGACGSFSSKNINLANVLFVNDTLNALTEVARYKKNLIKTKIAITGTAGKTTTKELLAFSLGKFYEIYFTKGNFNNQIGLPLTLANVNKNYEYGIFELGASRKGDIKYLSKILEQDISIITNVGFGHIAGYKNFKELLMEKLSIIEPSKTVIVNEKLKNYVINKEILTFGYSQFVDAKVLESKLEENGTYGKIKINNKIFEIFFPFFNLKIIENSCVVFLIFKILGIDFNKLPEIFREFKPPKGRGNIEKLGNLSIIDDTYNANPNSVKNAIDTLNKLKGRKILILGDMLELGEYSKEKHEEIGKFILKSNIDKIYLYGEEVKHTYEILKNKKNVKLIDKVKIFEELKKLKESYFVLIKGSRSMKMEEIIEYLKGEKSP